MGKPRSIKIERGVAEILARYDCNPFEELIKMSRESIKDPETGERVPLLSVAQRIEVWKTLCPYLQPTLRATEVTGEVNHNFSLEIVQFSGKPTEKSIMVKATQQITDGDDRKDTAAA